jgi:hypothetical protein
LGCLIEEAFIKLTVKYGSVNCRVIARVDWNHPDQFEYHFMRSESRHSICIDHAGETANTLGELPE